MCADRSEPFRNLDDFAGIASDWFWETDADHRFSYFSSRMEEVTRFNSFALIGQKRNVIPDENLNDPKWVAHMADLAAHRPFRNFEYKMRRPQDGSLLWIRIAGIPIFDNDGTFKGYRGTGHDITAEKLALAKLEASNKALESRNRELDEARCALERASLEDALTTVWNRRAFEKDLGALMSGPSQAIGLMHIDLDRFKWVNDTLGHPAGDAVLQTTAARICVATGDNGTVYRVGGDEFMVILKDTVTVEMATALGHRLTSAFSRPIKIGPRPVAIGASVGIAFGQNETTSAQQLISQVDAALYEAKNSGRNDVFVINAEIQHRIEDHRRLSADIPGALERGEFIPFFQPQVQIDTGQVIGAEVLIRWQHPERGLLPPSSFLQAAAELALIGELDREMLRQGLATVRHLAGLGIGLPQLSVNMSEARLFDPRLPSDIGCNWVDCNCALSFELLETIYFDDAGGKPHLQHILERIRSMGVQIETDDFGSGRASITGLLEVAPDRLKIDRGLVQEIVTSTQKRTMVRAILDMAQALGIECIAEGVETPEAMMALQDLGCNQVQGYAVSPPLSAADFETFLLENSMAAPALEQKETAGQGGLPQTA